MDTTTNGDPLARPPGPPSMDRWPFFWWGCGLMALKYNLDRLIAWEGFHRDWYFWNYIKPHGVSSIDALPPQDEWYYFVLLLTSLPFLVAGLFLTVRRLRSIGMPLAWCLCFFIPVLNLIFFVLLSVIPAREAIAANPEQPPKRRWLPQTAGGSALVSAIFVGWSGVMLASLSTIALRNYGWGLFVGLPFAMGLVAVLIYGGPQKRGFSSCMAVAILPVIFAGLFLLVGAIEGFICLLMAAPIALVLALMGGVVGYFIVSSQRVPLNPAATALILISLPFTMGMEKAAHESPPLLSVTSSVVVNAPPERVWPNVVSFPEIPAKRDWVLHTGIAYPIRARIDGEGVGALRHCIFTTGEFVEPIQVWDVDHLLRFSVQSQPEPMEELSPYPRLKTPHLDGYFLSREGEIRLTALAGGKTLLQGTTWYTDEIWPSRYWRMWSDMMIHHIHLRVLNHIRNLSER